MESAASASASACQFGINDIIGLFVVGQQTKPTIQIRHILKKQNPYGRAKHCATYEDSGGDQKGEHVTGKGGGWGEGGEEGSGLLTRSGGMLAGGCAATLIAGLVQDDSRRRRGTPPLQPAATQARLHQ